MERAFERRAWLMPIVLALLTLIFLRPVWLPLGEGQVLNSGDFIAMFYPLHQSIQQTIQSGELPLWNPYQMLGHPFIGNPHAALFYPATWFMWLVGVQRGMNLVLVFHTWLAAWGMARFARNWGATHIASLLAGVIYAMTGWAAARYYAGHYNLLVVFAWVPWSMVFYRHALARGTWRSTLPGMVVLGLALLAGHPPMVIYLLICLGTLWVYHTGTAESVIRAGWYAGRLLAITLIGGAILGAALLIPAVELTSLSNRSGADLSFANEFALQPAQYMMLALPFFFGNPKVGPYFYWGPQYFEEYTAYAGLLPLLAVPLVFRWRRQGHWYFIGLIALGLVLSVGVEGALLPVLVRWIPGFDEFRVPARALFLVMVGMAGLTALLITNLQTSRIEERREMLRPALQRWLPVAAAVAFVGAVFFAGWYSSANHAEPMPLRAFIDSGSLAEAGLALVGVWLVLWMWTQDDPKISRLALLATCTVIVLDGWHVAFPIVTIAKTPEDSLWAGARVDIPTGPDSRVVGPGGLLENLASVTGHLNVSGYDPLWLDTYRKLHDSADFNDPTTPVNTLLGVRYLLSLKPFNEHDWQLIGIHEGRFYYERKDPFPRTWIAQNISVEPDDVKVRQRIGSGKEDLQKTIILDHPVDCPTSGTGTATITAYRPNGVTIKASGDGGILTLSDQFYPGWQATIDGQPAEIIRSDTVFRSVCLPAGDHTVRFEYRPLSLYVGVTLSGVGWLALAAVALITFVRRPHRSETK